MLIAIIPTEEHIITYNHAFNINIVQNADLVLLNRYFDLAAFGAALFLYIGSMELTAKL